MRKAMSALDSVGEQTALLKEIKDLLTDIKAEVTRLPLRRQGT